MHVLDLSLAARAHGHDVMVLTGGTGPFTEDLAARDVPWINIPSLHRAIRPVHDVRAFRQIRSALVRLAPDVTSTHSSKAGLLGRAAARSLGLPVLFTAHGWAFHPEVRSRDALMYRALERIGTSLSSRIITVSDYDRNLALRLGVAPAPKLVTVHNGIPDLPQRLRARPGEGPPRFIMVARFEVPKDHMTLFAALAGLRDAEWEMNLIGDGPLLGEAQAKVAALGIGERIKFWGTRRDVAEHLARAHGFILISDREGFPLSILEAMRAGLPVVASAVGGIPESVADGVTGFLVPPRDPDALRARLAHLIADPEARASLGDQGRQRYQREFTLERCFSNTLEVYEELVRSQRQQSAAQTGDGPAPHSPTEPPAPENSNR